jgi:hypothetical protein
MAVFNSGICNGLNGKIWTGGQEVQREDKGSHRTVEPDKKKITESSNLLEIINFSLYTEKHCYFISQIFTYLFEEKLFKNVTFKLTYAHPSLKWNALNFLLLNL